MAEKRTLTCACGTVVTFEVKSEFGRACSSVWCRECAKLPIADRPRKGATA